MKFLNIAIIVTVFCLVCVYVNADDESPAAVPKRPSILLRRPTAQRTGPLGNKSIGVTTTTTTTTISPKSQNENDDIDEDDYDQNEDLEGAEKGDGEEIRSSSTTTTTTEPPKKIGPIIRPFRSNDDLLSALKRRQQSSKKGIQHKVVEKPIPAKVDETENEPTPISSSVSKPSNDRAGRRNKFTAKKSPSTTNGNSQNVDVNEQPSSPVVKRPVRFNLKTLKNK